MSTTVEKIAIEWEAKLDGFQREFAKIKGLPKQQADIALKSLNNQIRVEEKAHKSRIARIKEVEKAERAAAKAAEDATRDKTEKWEAIQKVAQGVGGSFGEMVGMADDLGTGLGGLAGKAGIAAAGVVAVGFAAFKGAEALTGLMNSASESVERLEKFEGLDPIPQETVDRIEAWDQAATAMGATADWLKVGLAGALAPAVTTVVHGIIGAVEVGKDVVEVIGDIGDVVTDTKDAFYDAMGPLGDFLDWADDGVAAVARFVTTGGLLGVGLRALARRGRDAAAGIREVGDAAADTKVDLDLLNGVVDLQVKMEEERLLAIGKITEAEKRENDQIRSLHADHAKLVDMIEQQVEAGEKSREQADKEIEASRIRLDFMTKLATQGKLLAGTDNSRADAASKVAEKAEALAEAERMLQEAMAVTASEEDLINQKYAERIARIGELVEKGISQGKAAQLLAEEEKAYNAEIDAVRAKSAEAEEKRAEERRRLLEEIAAVEQGTLATSVQGMDELEVERQAALARELADFESKQAKLQEWLEAQDLEPEVRAAILAELEELERGHVARVEALHDEFDARAREKRQQQIEETLAAYGTLTNAIGGLFAFVGDQIKEKADEAAERWTRLYEREQELQEKLLKARKRGANEERIAVLESQLAQTEARKQAARQEFQARKKAAMAAFRGEQLAGVAEVGIHTATAVMEAAPSIPLMAAMGILGGTQAAAIMLQKPPQFPTPQFHTGMTPAYSAGPDEVNATLLKGESVLDRRATQDVGPENIDRLNRGLPPAPPAPNYLVLGDDVIELIADKVTRSRAFESRMPRRGPRGLR